MTGTSVRKVDDLVKGLGADTGISRSEVSRICAELDTEVATFADRDLSSTTFTHEFLDATYCMARVGDGKGGKGCHVAIADYIENCHNTRRRHSALDMLTPTDFETLNTPQLHHA